MSEYRVAVVGVSNVGKSALIMQFTQGIYNEGEEYVCDSYMKQLSINNDICKVDIMDTEGGEQYSSLRDGYMRSAQGFLLVYSITSRSSFEELTTFRDQILRLKSSSPPFVIVGNKCDLEERVISTSEGLAFASSLGCPFYETSAKKQINVTDSFIRCIQDIRNNQTTQNVPNNSSHSQGRQHCLLQ